MCSFSFIAFCVVDTRRLRIVFITTNRCLSSCGVLVVVADPDAQESHEHIAVNEAIARKVHG